MKQLAKRIVVWLLGGQVKRLRRKHQFTVIGVAGSIGKTSTKMAIAQLLGGHLRVRAQDGNYNDLVTVPLIFFGHQNPPNLTNPFAWLKLLLDNQKQISRDYPYDVVVVELGTDGPGQLKDFAQYLHLDIAVLTAIAPEHMEYFQTIEAVAEEELSVAALADKVIVNTDLTMPYADSLTDGISYGLDNGTYHFTKRQFEKDRFTFALAKDDTSLFDGTYVSYAEVSLYSLLAAAACADQLGLKPDEMQASIDSIHAAPGRMQTLAGIKDSLILDDSYNASPDAVIASLQTLYSLDAPQKITLLGNMNELGDTSADAHTKIGENCDPKLLNWVITLGPDANQYSAPAAEAKGCQVKVCTSPYEAGKFIAEVIEPHAAVLIKGSQNGVFAEESIKYLLADPADRAKLVRQSPPWLKKKQEQFADYEA